MTEKTKLKPNDDAYGDVSIRLANGEELTFEMIGDIFGQEFWMILVYSLMDAQDASRAIAGAILALRQQSKQEAFQHGPQADDVRVEEAV